MQKIEWTNIYRLASLEEFETSVVQERGKLKVLIFSDASRCLPCMKLLGELETLLNDEDNSPILEKADFILCSLKEPAVEEVIKVFSLPIHSIPKVFVVQNGEIVSQFVWVDGKYLLSQIEWLAEVE